MLAINNQGIVAGVNESAPGLLNGMGLVWIWDPVDGTQVISLPGGWGISGIFGINDLDQIVAQATFTDPSAGPGAQPSFIGDVILAQAAPEPATSSLMLLAIGVAGAARIVKRKR